MAAQEIGVLRSPAVHHPHPDPFALRRFAERWPDPFAAPYDRPRTEVFAAFCREVAAGGGLSAGHLVRGATVVWLVRRTLRLREFDSDPGWLGPKYLKGFEAESDWQRRWEMVQQARDGGSLTPAIYREIQVQPWENTAVISAQATPTGIVLQTERGAVRCDRLWLATGMEVTVETEPLLQEVRERYPTLIVGGWPVLDERLRWPGTEVFVMGALASLRLGPAARNLFGARLACDRLVPALRKPSLAVAA